MNRRPTRWCRYERRGLGSRRLSGAAQARREGGAPDHGLLQLGRREYQQPGGQHLAPLHRRQIGRTEDRLHRRGVGIDGLQQDADGDRREDAAVAGQAVEADDRAEDEPAVDQIGHFRRDHRIDCHRARRPDGGAVRQLPQEQTQRAGHHQHRDHQHAPDEEPRQQRLARRPGPAVHDAGLGRLEREREPERAGSDHVDPEDLHRRERQRKREHDRRDHHQGLAAVGRQHEQDELAHVVVDRPTFAHRGCDGVEANYADNPYFPDVLSVEMEYDRQRDPDKYAHVWLGQYERNSEARVFKNWRIEEFEAPSGVTFRLGADWGFSIDPSVLLRCYIDGRSLYVDHEAYMIGCEIVNLPELFMSVPEAEKWPMVADSARPETISHMRQHGFPRILSAVKGPRSLEEGVEWLKSFDIVVHPRCRHLIDELTMYSYKTDPLTGLVLPVLADKDNHCVAEGTLVTCKRGDVPIEQVTD